MSTDQQKREEHTHRRRAYWDDFATGAHSGWESLRRVYLGQIRSLYRLLIPPGMRVLELGCGQGELLESLKPVYGVGVDFAPRMLEAARRQHPGLHFVEADTHNVDLGETFDFIVLSDLLNDLWDAQQVLWVVLRHCHADTRVILNSYSRVWELPRRVAEVLRLVRPQLTQNWFTGSDIGNLLYLTGFEVVRECREILCPVRIPFLVRLANRYLVKLWPFRWLALTSFIVARRRPSPAAGEEVKVSVVVAARNEEGNVPAIFARIPQLGAGTELIFVEGNSTDDTWGAIEREIGRHPGMCVKLFKQSGKGKGDAVRMGFSQASGEILMILDADLTVAPEDLPRFYAAVREGTAELANGVRLVYPMGDRAMRFFNLLGNRFFSLAFSWLLGQSIKDTLCGTKVLSRRHYETIAANRAYFGDFDPFGDFDLIFGAAKLNLKIVDIPIRYQERTYGETNIRRWRHGAILLRMLGVALRRLKFVD